MLRLVASRMTNVNSAASPEASQSSPNAASARAQTHVRQADLEGIISRTTTHDVVAILAIYGVITALTIELVIVIPAFDRVVSRYLESQPETSTQKTDEESGGSDDSNGQSK